VAEAGAQRDDVLGYYSADGVTWNWSAPAQCRPRRPPRTSGLRISHASGTTAEVDFDGFSTN